MNTPVYALVIAHETMHRQSYDDYDAGKITIDIRGWDAHRQSPTSISDYAFPYHNLQIEGWYSEKFSGTYGQSMGIDLGSDLLTLATLERYSKPLKALHKKLDAIAARYGEAKTIGQLLAYVADALTITQFARPNTHYPQGWQGSTDIHDAIAWCDYPIAQFHEAHAAKKQTSAA